MKITSLTMGVFLVFILAIGIVMTFFNVGAGNELYEDQAYKQLVAIAESKALRVEYFLDNRKADAVFLAESEDVKSVFDEELVDDVGLMTAKIKSVAENTRDEIEEYIKEHPNMTVEDLQGDEAFRSIAVQRVGDTGYTAIGDSINWVNVLHKAPDAEGFDLTKFAEIDPVIWAQFQNLGEFGTGSGFYEHISAEGVIRDKYQYLVKTDIVTADGAALFVAATTFIDEYDGSIQLASGLDKDFKLFQQKKGYDDLIFIDPDGDVIWTAKQHNELGTNLVTGVYNDSLLASVYDRAKRDLGVGVSDSEAYGSGDKLGIFVTAPVMETNNLTGKRELRGIVALELSNDKISDLIETDVGLGEVGEVYIVNRDRNHITGIKFDYHNSSVSEDIGNEHGEIEILSSEGIDNCFDDYDNYYLALQEGETKDVPKVARYLNYAENPNMVLGAHQYILGSGWCVIAEMGEEYFLEVIPRTNTSLAINLLTLVLLLLIVSLLLDSFFKVRRKGR